MNKFFFQYILIFSAIVSQVSAESLPTLKTIPLIFENKKQIQVEVARTEKERARGLMYRNSLPDDRGMLFLLDFPVISSFWMKNCKISLDILWVNEKKEIIAFHENTPPCQSPPCPIYTSPQKILYVLETNSGFIKKEGIKEGMKIHFSFDN